MTTIPLTSLAMAVAAAISLFTSACASAADSARCCDRSVDSKRSGMMRTVRVACSFTMVVGGFGVVGRAIASGAEHTAKATSKPLMMPERPQRFSAPLRKHSWFFAVDQRRLIERSAFTRRCRSLSRAAVCSRDVNAGPPWIRPPHHPTSIT